MWKRTNETQTEKTKSGIITTVKEVNQRTKQVRWAQIGYTSTIVRVDAEGRKHTVATGPYGRALLKEEDIGMIIPE